MAFTRRGGRSPERAKRGKEAPAAQDACPRQAMLIENLKGVVRGDARGAAQGAQPHNRPRLAVRRAGVQTSPEGETLCPQGRMNETSPAAQARAARRAGEIPPSPLWGNPLGIISQIRILLIAPQGVAT